MKKIEVHCKTKYSTDKDSTIDIESVLWNAKENKEKGIIFSILNAVLVIWVITATVVSDLLRQIVCSCSCLGNRLLGSICIGL